jgi:hypothetical protein
MVFWLLVGITLLGLVIGFVQRQAGHDLGTQAFIA